MKTLKQQYEELNRKTIDAIVAGEFKFIDNSYDYTNVRIEVDGLDISFWIGTLGHTYINTDSSFGEQSDIALRLTDSERFAIYNRLEKATNSFGLTDKKKKLERLEDEIQALKREIEQSLK